MNRTRKILALALSTLLLVAAAGGCGTANIISPVGEPVSEKAAPESYESAENNSAGDIGGGAQSGGKNIFEDEIKIAFIPFSTMGITNVLYQRSIDEFLIMYPNVSVNFFDSMFDVNNQISYLGEVITQGYDAVVLECLDTEALNGAIAEVEASGIPVITYNSGSSGLCTVHLEGFDYKAGEMAAKVLSEACGGVGTAILLDVPPEQKAYNRMGTGFTDYITNNTDIEILEEVGIPNWSQENANTAMRDLLTKYDDITVVFGVGDDVAVGAIQAIEAAGREGDGILVHGNMGYSTGLDAVADGSMYGTLFSDIYVQIQTVLSFALYFITSGVTSVSAGYTETPQVGYSLLPVNADNVLEVYAFSRWK